MRHIPVGLPLTRRGRQRAQSAPPAVGLGSTPPVTCAQHGATAVVEIESAIERLSPAEVKELAAWLEEYQQMINASAEIFSMYEQEEGGR